MEIPYIVEARKDTGLWNAKMGMWLFLASEVMLFGGLFSAYIFLRLGSDTVWPTEVQDWKLGAFNTAVLILSSVTIVFAWTSILLKKWRAYVFFMSVTVACAFLFLFLKLRYEYAVKLTHNAIILKDGSVIEGHYHGAGHGKDEKSKHNNTGGAEEGMHFTGSLNSAVAGATNAGAGVFPEELEIDLAKITRNSINGIAEHLGEKGVAYLDYYDFKNVKALRKEAPPSGYSPFVTIPLRMLNPNLSDEFSNYKEKIKLDSFSLIEKRKKVSVANLVRELLSQKSDFSKNKSAFRYLDNLMGNKKNEFITENKLSSVRVTFSEVKPIFGEVANEGTGYKFTFMEAVHFLADNIDLRNVRKREDDGINFEETIEMKKGANFFNSYWNNNDLDNLKENVKSLDETVKISELGTSKYNRVKFDKGGEVDIWIKRSDIKRETVWGPSYNNYFGIYYAVTGLHAIHVLGGALVMLCFIFFKKMYKKNHLLLANRVECLGLFWHFVDLVWIFAFPIFYLF